MTLRLNDSKWRRFIRSLRRDPVRGVRKQWAVRYSAFVRRRYSKEGDGDWQALAPSTLAKRRKKGKGAKILRDTGILYGALEVGASGNYLKRLRRGLRFGFANTPYPGSDKSIRAIAIIHQRGSGRNPKREILVDPDQKTMNGMISDLKRSIKRTGKGL